MVVAAVAVRRRRVPAASAAYCDRRRCGLWRRRLRQIDRDFGRDGDDLRRLEVRRRRRRREIVFEPSDGHDRLQVAAQQLIVALARPVASAQIGENMENDHNNDARPGIFLMASRVRGEGLALLSWLTARKILIHS